jgi:hypothetical protein
MSINPLQACLVKHSCAYFKRLGVGASLYTLKRSQGKYALMMISLMLMIHCQDKERWMKKSDDLKTLEPTNSDGKKTLPTTSSKTPNPLLTKALLKTLKERYAQRQEQDEQLKKAVPVSDKVM